MKKVLSILFILLICIPPCHAQFGALKKLYKSAKEVIKQNQTNTHSNDDFGNKRMSEIMKGVTVDTTSIEYKKASAEALQKMYEANPEFKKMMELQGDTLALRKYMQEQYGGLTEEEITKKALKNSGIDYDSKDFQDAKKQTDKMLGFQDDPLFKKIMSEGRSLTKNEAAYFKEKYGVDFEYDGMEAYNDSVGIYAKINGRMIPMSLTKPDKISEDRPGLDLGLNEIKQYVNSYLSALKKPFADREVVDSVQNYMIFNHLHAENQFKETARFIIYSNPEQDADPTVNDLLLRRLGDFMNPIDPNNIFVFKVHKGISCRYMEYQYSKISYKESELNDYICKHLIDDGYIDASINQKITDEEMYKAMDKLELQFKIDKLMNIINNGEKFIYTNVIPAAKGVSIKTSTRKVGAHVTALDVNIEAEPGEYAFIIRNPEVEEELKKIGGNIDISVLNKGAFFFTIK